MENFFNQIISASSGDLEANDWLKIFQNYFFNFVKSIKSGNLIKFSQNFQFLTFVIFVAEIPNKHFCKLDKILKILKKLL